VGYRDLTANNEGRPGTGPAFAVMTGGAEGQRPPRREPARLPAENAAALRGAAAGCALRA
jgi:hypothetical protein